jgi:integrase/recombinase XerD
MSTANFPGLLQRFFMDRLVHQLGASEHTVASYRDTFRLLLCFAEERLGRAPSALHLGDLDAPFLSLFLDHLEAGRHNCIRTRNTRLAALHAFFRYAAFAGPAHALQCQQVLAIPGKRHERGPVEFLSQEEAAALTAAPDPSRWIGRRDHTLLLLALQTSLRHSAAMDLLRRGVDLTVIALWLGHESTETTQAYIHADMGLKEKALSHASPSGLPPLRFRPTDGLLAFLEAL